MRVYKDSSGLRAVGNIYYPREGYLQIPETRPESVQKSFYKDVDSVLKKVFDKTLPAPSKVRYIRVFTNGNTANVSNIWSEIEAFNKEGVNIAFGKAVTGQRSFRSDYPSSNVVDGNIASYGVIVGNGTQTYAQVDLGDLYDITNIRVFHPTPGRVYHETKLEVSEDGTTWLTVFDSAIEGEYVETAEGRNYVLMT